MAAIVCRKRVLPQPASTRKRLHSAVENQCDRCQQDTNAKSTRLDGTVQKYWRRPLDPRFPEEVVCAKCYFKSIKPASTSKRLHPAVENQCDRCQQDTTAKSNLLDGTVQKYWKRPSDPRFPEEVVCAKCYFKSKYALVQNPEEKVFCQDNNQAIDKGIQYFISKLASPDYNFQKVENWLRTQGYLKIN